MIIGFGNNVVSSLAADITASQTTIQVMPGTGAMFANLLTSDYVNSSNPLKTYAKITLTDAKETAFEVCHLTAVNIDMLTVIRGQEGTTAKGWSLNDVIANFATRGSENQFVQIEELQSGHYVAGVAGGTENNLTLELPATYFVNGGADWTLRTPLVVIPVLNNTGPSTLQLTMGGRVLGKFPLYKGNKAELSANDIIKDAPVLCVLDNTRTYFSVLNPLEIYLGSRYLQKDRNGADIPNKPLFIQNLGLQETVNQASGALQKNQNGADIPGKDTFTKNIGACRAYSAWLNIGDDSQAWTTAQFISWLESQGAFNHPYWMCKGSWAYANNKVITDTGCGNICLAGAVVEVIGTRGAMTIRVTTPSTSSGGGITNAQFTYINHGDAYAPGWRRDYNTKNQQPAFALGQTGSRVANDKAVGWNWNSGVYDADISGASTLILHFNMNAGSCPAVQFRVNYKNGGIFYRSARDGYGFEANWSEFYTTTRKPSAGDVGAYTKAESDSSYVKDVRLGSQQYYGVNNWQTWNFQCPSGHVLSGINVQDTGSNSADNIAGVYYRPVQKYINGTWYNVASV